MKAKITLTIHDVVEVLEHFETDKQKAADRMVQEIKDGPELLESLLESPFEVTVELTD